MHQFTKVKKKIVCITFVPMTDLITCHILGTFSLIKCASSASSEWKLLSLNCLKTSCR